jgi:hypothetical protein
MVYGGKLKGYRKLDEVRKLFESYTYMLYTLDIKENESKEVEIGNGIVLRIYRLDDRNFELELQGKHKTLKIRSYLRNGEGVIVNLPEMIIYRENENLARVYSLTDAYGYKTLLGDVSPFELYLEEGHVVLKVLEYSREKREKNLIFLPIIVGGTFLLFYATNLSGFSVKLQSNFQILFIIFSLFFVFGSIFLLFLSRGSKKI